MDTTVASSMALEHLESFICQHAANLTAAEYQWLLAVGEFDRRRGWEPWEVRSCAEWLSWQVGLDIRAAREKVRVAHKLVEFPLVADAMSKGHLSYSKVRAITRITTTANEAQVVDLAMASTTSQVEAMVSAYRRATPPPSRPDGSEVGAVARQWLHQHSNDDGTVTISLCLPADTATAMLSAIEIFLDDIPAELGLTTAHRRAEAAVAMAEHAAAHYECERTENAAQPRYLVVLHTNGADQCEIEGIGSSSGDPRGVDSDTALRLMCNAVFEVVNHEGELISDRNSLITGRLRRFILHRDRTCRFPGCARRTSLDIHHLVPRWQNGGNQPDNLATLCRFHHHRLHEHGWSVEWQGDELVFHLPNGQVATGASKPVHGEAAVVANCGRTSRDGQSRWDGTRLDRSWVTEGLLLLEQHAHST